MIICHHCERANGLTGEPVPGDTSCECCGAATVNGCVKIPGLTPEQRAKAKVARASFVDRMLDKVREQQGNPEKPS